MNNSLYRDGTNRTYQSLWKNWVKPISYTITSQKLAEKVATLWLSQGKSPRTVKILLRLLANDAKQRGIDIDVRPITRMVMKNVEDKAQKALNKEQAGTLLNACKGTKIYLPVLLALSTGMRRGEVWGLRWEDVDLGKGYIHVKRSYEGPTKNGKTRQIPISQTLHSYLSNSKRNFPNNHVVIDLFDPNPILKEICKKVHIPIINFHALRHTFATLCLEGGRSPKLVQEALGHSNLNTTLNIYWNSTKEKIDLENLL